jgi:predicted dinucleotide-binding enzyme
MTTLATAIRSMSTSVASARSLSRIRRTLATCRRCGASATAFSTTFAGTLVAGQVAGQPLDVFIAGDDPAAKQTLAELVQDGGLIPVDVGPLARAQQLEGLGYLGISIQQPLGLNFASAWKLLH